MNYNIIILSIILFLLIIYDNNQKITEKNTNINTLEKNIKEHYLFDFIGLKNLGYICEKIYNDETKTLELPYNVEIEGVLNASNITAAGYGQFGVAQIGNTITVDEGTNEETIFATFGHKQDNNEIDNTYYALKQDGVGNTIINYTSTNDYTPKEIRFRMNNINDANGKIQIAGIKGKDIDSDVEIDVDGNTIIGNVKARSNLNFVEQINSSGNKFRVKTDTNNCLIQTDENEGFEIGNLVTGDLTTGSTLNKKFATSITFDKINLANGQTITAKWAKARDDIYIRVKNNDICKYYALAVANHRVKGSGGSDVVKNFVVLNTNKKITCSDN